MNSRRFLLRYRHRLLFLLVASLLLATAVVPAAGEARPRALVKIVKAPPKRTAATKAVFRFKRVRAARTLCRIDRRRYRPCRVRAKYRRMSRGRHIFRVRANRNGRVTVARRRWRVVRSVQGATSPPSPRKLRFADEFNGSSLDTTQWRAWNGAGHDGHGLRRASAFSVSGGNLVVTAKMVNGKIVSGGMSHKTDYTYGRYEFRVRTERDPTGTMSGIVLTWPKHQRSPDFTENDMYETGPSAARDKFQTFIHYGKGVRTQKFFQHRVDATRWHTVAMDWRPNSLKIYRDGAHVWTVTDKAAIPDVLHHVGIQLDARHARKLTKSVRMYIDYVRIYE